MSIVEDWAAPHRAEPSSKKKKKPRNVHYMVHSQRLLQKVLPRLRASFSAWNTYLDIKVAVYLATKGLACATKQRRLVSL